jgi:RNA recognition motif-containing protein
MVARCHGSTVQIVRDPTTNKSREFGIVKFETVESAKVRYAHEPIRSIPSAACVPSRTQNARISRDRCRTVAWQAAISKLHDTEIDERRLIVQVHQPNLANPPGAKPLAPPPMQMHAPMGFPRPMNGPLGGPGRPMFALPGLQGLQGRPPAQMPPQLHQMQQQIAMQMQQVRMRGSVSHPVVVRLPFAFRR